MPPTVDISRWYSSRIDVPDTSVCGSAAAGALAAGAAGAAAASPAVAGALEDALEPVLWAIAGVAKVVASGVAKRAIIARASGLRCIMIGVGVRRR